MRRVESMAPVEATLHFSAGMWHSIRESKPLPKIQARLNQTIRRARARLGRSIFSKRSLLTRRRQPTARAYTRSIHRQEPAAWSVTPPVSSPLADPDSHLDCLGSF